MAYHARLGGATPISLREARNLLAARGSESG